MGFGIRSKIALQRPWGQLRKGWVYTRHSLRFEVVHPVILCLTLLQIGLSIGLFAGIFAIAFLVTPSTNESVFMAIIILSYFFMSVTTILLNGTIAGYVLATELGVLHPLSQAIEQVRNRLVSLVSYAIVWASIITIFVVLDWVTRLGAFTESVNVIIQFITFVMNIIWAAGTIFVVPILIFEPTTSLRSAIQRSAAFLKESVLCLLVFWFVGVAMFATIVGGAIVLLFVAASPLALVTSMSVVFAGFIAYYTLSTIFNSLLYGEVAGPLDLSKSQN